MCTIPAALPARQVEAVRIFRVVAERAGGALGEVQWLERRNNGRGYMSVSELHAEIQVGDVTCNLVYYDGVAVQRGGWFGYLSTEPLEERNAVNRLLTERCGEPWTDVAARGW